MDSSDLTREQLDHIKATLREQQAYFRRLLARMDARGFPADDRLRREVQDVEQRLGSLWMSLHYLGCAGQTGGPRIPLIRGRFR